jgi:hypothetical protein
MKKGRVRRLSERAGRNASERRAGLETVNVGADPPIIRGRPHPTGRCQSGARLHGYAVRPPVRVGIVIHDQHDAAIGDLCRFQCIFLWRAAASDSPSPIRPLNCHPAGRSRGRSGDAGEMKKMATTAAVLDRAVFTTSRLLEYFSESELTARIACARDGWRGLPAVPCAQPSPRLIALICA